MRRAATTLIAISLIVLATGCSSVSNLFSPQAAAQLTPEQEAREDQKCQSDGYQLNTPAYTYCRGELARQRTIAETVRAVPPPPITAHR
jgi:hypothetical protein